LQQFTAQAYWLVSEVPVLESLVLPDELLPEELL